MPKAIKAFILISVILFFHIGIFSHLAILQTYPNLVLICLISMSVLMGFKKTLSWAITFGLILDVYSLNNFIGISVISLVISVYLAYFLCQNIFKKSNLLSMIPVFALVTVAYNLSFLILYKVFGIEFHFRILTLIFDVIYNTIIAIPVFYLFKNIYAGRPKKI